MATIIVTNLDTVPTTVGDLYTTLAVGGSVTTSRALTDLPRMANLQNLIANGKVSLSVTNTADESASGLASSPNSVGADDFASVSAATVAAPLQTMYVSIASGGGGSPADSTLFAVNTFPYKVRVMDVVGYVSTAVAASTVTVRTAAAGGGALLGSLDSATTGRKETTAPVGTTVVTPGGAVGLFVRRSDNGVACEVMLTVRRES